MRITLISCFLLVSFLSKAGEIKYPVSAIPEKLLKNADVVKRMEDIQFEIINLNEAYLRKKFALTILNENGNEQAMLVVGYDKLTKVNNIDGNLYDAQGNLIKSLKNKDIQDFSAVQSISLIDDNRVKVHNFNYKTFPYTVEYIVETKLNNTYAVPDWFPQNDEHLAVQQSSFAFIYPEGYTVRYKQFNYNEQPITTLDKNKKRTYWEIKNLASITKPFASPKWNEISTAVYFAPSEFEMEGYRGNGSTWQDLGKFQIALNKDRDKLPEAFVQKIKKLIDGVSDEKEKIKILYQYLQQNTRYISIQLGIGGMQPFEASYVAEKGYGDCKALSNYMCSLLSIADIKGYYCWVKGGDDADDRYLIEDFPSDQFNHIIVCVPLQKDTMWLECTNQSIPAGYMGQFTGNRKALLINENGGVLVSTPRYGLKENIQLRNIKATLDEEGTLIMNVNTNYGGTQQDELSMITSMLSKDKVEKRLQQKFDLSTYQVKSFNYEQTKAILPELKEQLDIEVSNYATVAGKRLFIVPNILNRGGMNFTIDDERTVDFVFDDEWRDEDTYEIELPKGYQLEATAEDVSFKTKYGSYSSSAKLDGNKLIYHRVREQYKGRFPAKEQSDIAKYYSDVYKADRARMVFVKKD